MNAAMLNSRLHRTAGFTIVELVTVMILAGILAAMALPRFADRNAFESRGFRDETVSLLRWAQKSAVAQRRTVCVTVAAAGVTLTVDTDTPPDGSCNALPGGALSLPNTPRGGSGLAGAGFNFLASGATSGSGTITLTVAGANSISIDAVTGYVR